MASLVGAVYGFYFTQSSIKAAYNQFCIAANLLAKYFYLLICRGKYVPKRKVFTEKSLK